MAKRLIKWTLDGSVLKISKHLEDPKAVAVIEAEFDLTKIFPNIMEMTEVQRNLCIYGVKQNLADPGASQSDAPGKIKAAKDRWAEYLAGKWTGERVNATGAAENKIALAKVKEVQTTKTLAGLSVKQLLHPELFTEQDQKDLDELIQAAAKVAAKNAVKK